MTMSGNLILLVFLSALISINGQYDDERDLPQGSHIKTLHIKISNLSSL
jgi:hypothetical protein